MKIWIATAVLAGSFALPAQADSYWELEAARANARAGGPVSERDAELLDRYGCLSGTRNAFCEARDRKYYGRKYRARARR